MFSSCVEDRFTDPNGEPDSLLKINLSGQIEQNYVSRADDGGFADGDIMGVFIVDYDGNNPGTLKNTGNRGDNVRHTFNESSFSWNSAYDVYWKDKHTSIDVYGYYPFASVDNVSSYSFSVSTDQDATPADGSMGGYEASDFLWAKVAGVAPTTNVIRLPLAHKMASAKVSLVEGEGFSDGEFAGLSKQVLVANTIHDCTINLSDGTVTPTGDVSRKAIIPSKRDNDWRAIVVPQKIPAGTTMFTISIDGLPYKFSKNEDFTYVSGKMNNFAIKVDKKSSSGQYALSLISESITPWENDLVSHDATLKEYVVIDVAEPGTLKQCIADAGKDLTKLRNLKVTGRIDNRDFIAMREMMPMLGAVNLKDVKIEANEWQDYEGFECSQNDEDAIPFRAFNKKESLITFVMPDKLKVIRDEAFGYCTNLSGSLIIPEGVVEIGNGAFFVCTSLTGNLSLPSTLKKLGEVQGYDSYWDGVFRGCNFTCEIILPESLEIIGLGAFRDCN